MSSHSTCAISVVLDTYNGGRYLKQLLDSLSAQTVAPLELIISDDASTDNTNAVIDEFIKTDALNVTVIRNIKRLGYADNFLSACSICKGNIIAFCDQDDIWEPNKLDVLSKVFANERVKLCIHRASVIDEEGELIGYFDQGIKKDQLCGPFECDPLYIYFGFSMAFKKSLLSLLPSSNRPFDPLHPERKFGHDNWVYTLANIIGHTAKTTDRLVRYRQHERNVFGIPKAGALKEKVELLYSRSARKRFIEKKIRESCAKINYLEAIERVSAQARASSAAGNFAADLVDNRRSEEAVVKQLRSLKCVAEIYSSHTVITSIAAFIRAVSLNTYYCDYGKTWKPRDAVRDLLVIAMKIF